MKGTKLVVKPLTKPLNNLATHLKTQPVGTGTTMTILSQKIKLTKNTTTLGFELDINNPQSMLDFRSCLIAGIDAIETALENHKKRCKVK